MITIKQTIAAATLLLTAVPAGASCLNNGKPPSPPAVLQPQAGEVYGCPVYTHISNGKFWFSNFVEPNFDNNLYGFELPAAITGTITNGTINGTINGSGKNNQANQITAIAAQNWVLTQFSNAFNTDMALIGITFTPTAQTFDSGTPDGPVIIIAGGIRQGF